MFKKLLISSLLFISIICVSTYADTNKKEVKNPYDIINRQWVLNTIKANRDFIDSKRVYEKNVKAMAHPLPVNTNIGHVLSVFWFPQCRKVLNDKQCHQVVDTAIIRIKLFKAVNWVGLEKLLYYKDDQGKRHLKRHGVMAFTYAIGIALTDEIINPFTEFEDPNLYKVLGIPLPKSNK